MTTVLEIEKAIQTLPDDQFVKLKDWVDDYYFSKWDKQFQADINDGKLNTLLNEVDEEIAGGHYNSL